MTPIVLRPDQQQLKHGIYSEWNAGHPNVLGVLPTGGGKCLGRDTPVLMFDGTARMSQDVRAGDILMGPDSGPRFVVRTTYGVDQLYRVVPRKGDPYVVNSKHVLSLRRTNETTDPKFACHGRGGEIVNLPVTAYLAKSKWWRHIHKGWRAPVDFAPNTPLEIEPYFVGLWLGDGTSRHTCITTMDGEVFMYLADYAQRLGMRFRFEQQPNNRAFGIHIVGERNRKSTPMTLFLDRYNLRLNKHIPLCYKTASREDRLQLLAGILDSDGHYDGKSYDVIFKVERLMDDLIYLARSLGFSAYKTPCQKTCTNNGVTGTYYRCSINGDLDQIPCRIARQKAAPRRQKKNVLNVGIAVEPIGKGDYYGFEVAGADHLFLLGDFTVTHNSIVTTDIILDGHQQGMREIVMAHRNELVGQMSLHVAKRGIKHSIIGPRSLVAQTIQEHRAEFNGRSFVNPDAYCAVGSVQTIVAREAELKQWAAQVDRWTLDEAHHGIGNERVEPNMWGKAIRLFTNARGLGVTACPQRADGRGLGRHADGPFDAMVVGPNMRELIDLGGLSDYEIIIPALDNPLELTDDDLTASGDFSPVKMREASKRSHIVGDVVEQYIRWVYGKRSICFATDVETANDIAARFNALGIPAASVSAKTDRAVRRDMIQRFKDGRLWVLVNVDLFDEGFDVPACEVVIMARPTASLNKYLQMFGRAMRVFAGKLFGIVLDMVSNWKRHGFPDKPHHWTMDRREKRAKKQPDPEDIPLTACRECSRPYERCLPACPYCGATPPLPDPAARTLQQVDGDFTLLDRAMVAQMKAATVLETPGSAADRAGLAAGPAAAKGAANRSMEKHAAQTRLSNAFAQWAAIQRARGRDDQQSYRRIYLSLGVDMLSALAADDRATYERYSDIVEGWCV